MARYRLKNPHTIEATQNENGYWEIKFEDKNCMMEDGQFKELYEPVYDLDNFEEPGEALHKLNNQIDDIQGKI